MIISLDFMWPHNGVSLYLNKLGRDKFFENPIIENLIQFFPATLIIIFILSVVLVVVLTIKQHWQHIASNFEVDRDFWKKQSKQWEEWETEYFVLYEREVSKNLRLHKNKKSNLVEKV